MSSQDERRAKGVAAFNSVYGGMMTAPDERTGDDFFEIMLEDLFGNIWSREGLSLRDRRLFTMGIIAALGEADVFGIQVETGLASGHLTVEQVNELILHMVQYAGYPRTTGMRGAAMKAIANWKKRQKEQAAQP